MGGDEHIRESEEALEDIVLNDGAAEIFVKEIRLLLVDVEAEVADVAGLEGVGDILRIDEARRDWC